MVEVIDNVAYLKNILDKSQSKDMWEYLKSNPSQELYIIEGQNKYGCGTSGELVPFTAMPKEKKTELFCISDFYIPQENVDLEPLAVPTQTETIAEDIISNEEALSQSEPSETVVEPVEEVIDYKKLYEDAKHELDNAKEIINCLKELDVKNIETIAKLEQDKFDLQSALFAMKEKKITLDEVIEFVRNGEGMEFKVLSKDL